MSLALAILPIFLVIGCGYILCRSGIMPRNQWDSVETLSFRLLLPAMVINAFTKAEFSLLEVGPFISAVVLTTCLAGFLIFALRYLIPHSRLGNPSFTTVFQTTTRWNLFVTLAAIEQFAGSVGLTLIAVAMAFLMPMINVANIIVLAIYGQGQLSIRGIFTTLLKNPIIQGCIIGLSIAVLGISLPSPLIHTLDLISRAAIGIGLLSVGAGISLARLLALRSTVVLGTLTRLILCPALFLALAPWFSLGQTEILTGILILAVPAAANGYIIARKMGGDAELYSDILMWQILVSMITIPVWILITGYPF